MDAVLGNRSLSDWQVNKLRVSVFPKGVNALDTHGWWGNVVGTPPESSMTQMRIGVMEDAGELTGILTLHIEFGRIDWLFTPQPTQEIGIFPNLGPFPDILDIFLRPIKKWFDLQTVPDIARIAFGAVLTKK